MGLLDEAIREHLELKRRSGADPGAVAREEREVLAPVFPDEHTGPNGAGGDPVEDATAELAAPDLVPDDDHAGESEGPVGFSSVGQDTAELDMQAVMEEDAQALEWEVPSEQDGESPPGESPPGDVPGQERLSFD
jgi:hypothetical protein